MTCPYRLGDCAPIDPPGDLWTGTLPKRAPNRHGFVHHHNHLPCIVDGPDGEVGWHPADDEPHPEPWLWRRARHPIQLAHPHQGHVLPWRVIASTIVASITRHHVALRALDGIYNRAHHPTDLPTLPLEEMLATVSRRTAKTRTLLELADRWDTQPPDWCPTPQWVADLPGAGTATTDTYRVLVLGEHPTTGNPVLTIHATLRQEKRLPATTLAP